MMAKRSTKAVITWSPNWSWRIWFKMVHPVVHRLVLVVSRRPPFLLRWISPCFLLLFVFFYCFILPVFVIWCDRSHFEDVRIGGLFSWASESIILLRIFLLHKGFFFTHSPQALSFMPVSFLHQGFLDVLNNMAAGSLQEITRWKLQWTSMSHSFIFTMSVVTQVSPIPAGQEMVPGCNSQEAGITGAIL